jgi:hypothetical protein
MVLLVAAANVPAPAASAAATTPVSTVACDVVLNVDDPDPNGLNVRNAPDARTGKVVAVLKPDGDWTEVHVVGQRGNWLQIDRADTIDDNADNGERAVFRGRGWVHVSKLGISELHVGEGTVVRDRPAPKGAVLLRIDNDDQEPKSTRVLGCDASYIKIEFDGRIGWTREWCTNERTTCS